MLKHQQCNKQLKIYMLLLSIGQLRHGVISLHMYREIVAYLQEIKWPTLFTVAVFCLNLVAVVF